MADEQMPQRFMLNPVTHHRDNACAEHGPYQETGGDVGLPGARIWWLGCPQCQRQQASADRAIEREREESIRQARIEQKLQLAGIPLAFRDCGFENFMVENAEMQAALDAARHFADTFWTDGVAGGRFMVFGGVTGTGKTHLAMAISRQVMRRGSVMYMDVTEMFMRIRGTWRKGAEHSEEEMYQMLGSIDLLTIDEVGVQRGTADEQNTLFNVINRRYRDNRPTILLTNLAGPAFIDYMGQRVMSRLAERARYVKFSWDDWRRRDVSQLKNKLSGNGFD